MNNELIKNDMYMSQLTRQENGRDIQEIQASMILAKRFPRDINQSLVRINEACKRRRLAESAIYAYPRGGQMVTGPSIRLAEVLAQNWGNLDFGIRELESGDGESLIEAYCRDLETNIKQTKTFVVKHERRSKNRIDKLSDPRDIYEHIANYGARRLRACILGVIPGDIIEDAIAICQKTLESGNAEPIADRIKKMILAFKDLGVTQDMIEERLGHKIDVTIEQELIKLSQIFTSIRDGMAKREDFFKFSAIKIDEKTAELNEKFKA